MPPRVGTTDQLRAMMRTTQCKSGRPLSSSNNKFSAVVTRTEHGKFDSRHEARWADTLKTLESMGYITDVQVDKRSLKYALDVNEVRIAQYEADARFMVLKDFPMPTLDGEVLLRAGAVGVLDAKSPPTRKTTAFVMKRNLMFAIHKIKLLEV